MMTMPEFMDSVANRYGFITAEMIAAAPDEAMQLPVIIRGSTRRWVCKLGMVGTEVAKYEQGGDKHYVRGVVVPAVEDDQPDPWTDAGYVLATRRRDKRQRSLGELV